MLAEELRDASVSTHLLVNLLQQYLPDTVMAGFVQRKVHAAHEPSECLVVCFSPILEGEWDAVMFEGTFEEIAEQIETYRQ